MLELTAGQRLPLKQLNVSDSADIVLNASGSARDYDAACFMLTANGKLISDDWMVFYNQPSSPDGAVQFRRSGPGSTFSVQLSRLSAQVERLAFTLAPDGGDMRGLSSGELSVSGAATWRFAGRDFSAEKAVIAAELYRHNGEWRLMINGQGYNDGLAGLVRHFGGTVQGQAPTPAPGSVPTPAASQPPAPPSSVRPSQGAAPDWVNQVNLGGSPPAPAPVPARGPEPRSTVSLTKVTLEKQGQTARINLQKAGTQRFHVNLNWEARPSSVGGGFLKQLLGGVRGAADLDLGCMYELSSGEKGVIQALGRNMGASAAPPYIHLDQDDRSGSSSSGENLYLERPDLISRVLVFAFIYEGAGNFSEVGGRLSFTDPQGNDVRMQLSNPAAMPFCAVALLQTRGAELSITKEERYFSGHRDCDQHYGFGFRWQAGRK